MTYDDLNKMTDDEIYSIYCQCEEVRGEAICNFTRGFFDRDIKDDRKGRLISLLIIYNIHVKNNTEDISLSHITQDMLKNYNFSNSNYYNSTVSNEYTFYTECYHCGQQLKFVVNVENFQLIEISTNDTCKFVPTTRVYTIKVDKGDCLVFGDNFGLTTGIKTESINYTYGNIKLSDDVNAKTGGVRIFVGNSCPSIYKNEDGTYFIPNNEFEDEDEDEDDVNDNDGVVRLGSVCTDLWDVQILPKSKLPLDRHYQIDLEFEPELVDVVYTVTMPTDLNANFATFTKSIA